MSKSSVIFQNTTGHNLFKKKRTSSIRDINPFYATGFVANAFYKRSKYTMKLTRFHFTLSQKVKNVTSTLNGNPLSNNMQMPEKQQFFPSGKGEVILCVKRLYSPFGESLPNKSSSLIDI